MREPDKEREREKRKTQLQMNRVKVCEIERAKRSMTVRNGES